MKAMHPLRPGVAVASPPLSFTHSDTGASRSNAQAELRKLPAIDEIMNEAVAGFAVDQYGRPSVVTAVRETVAEVRRNWAAGDKTIHAAEFATLAVRRLDADAATTLKAVFNLTGTVLHTNLGRAQLAEKAIAAAVRAMRNCVSLEFDISDGERGERDDHLRSLICELTGGEDATIVNNNAAAILLVLNSLAKGKETIVSRGELIEIGGAFRLPEIMSQASTKLKEVGTTNRTHEKDYLSAVGPRTGLLLKVHTSNYLIRGFVGDVKARAISGISQSNKIPFVYDLGSGTLVDLSRWGLPQEQTVAQVLRDGADLVTFSGDKLLGGPQAGFIVGKKELIAKINRNPMKRAMRVDKLRLAALEETLKLYRDPRRLMEELPTFRLLARPTEDIEGVARRLRPMLSAELGEAFSVEVVQCSSQVGSGAMPLQTLRSAGIAIGCAAKHSGRLLMHVAACLRQLPVPVIGRLEKRSLVLDFRCLEDEAEFQKNLKHLDLSSSQDFACGAPVS